MTVELEVGGKKYILTKREELSEGKYRRLIFSDGQATMELRLHKGVKGIRGAHIHVKVGNNELHHNIRRFELETMKRRLYYGDDHIVVIGDILIRFKPESFGLLFPREQRTRFFNFLKRLWELGIKIRGLKRFRR